MQAQKNTTQWWHYVMPPALLSAITALVYYPSLNYEFQFDDLANITKHFQIRHNSLRSLFFSGTRWISYWLNTMHYKIGRFDPYSYRIGNVFIHTANGLLVYYIIKTALSYRTQDSFFTRNAHSLSIVTALFFLLHPVQTQTVSYVIQGQLEGLACFFILAITLTFLKIARAQTWALYLGLTALLYTLAALSTGSKEIAIISPFLVLLVDWFFVAQGSVEKLKKRIWIHLALFGVVGGFYIWFLKPHFFGQIFGLKMEVNNNIGNVITHDPSHTITPMHYFISQFKVILHYLWMFVWPLGISVEYDWKLAENFFAPDAIIPFFGLIAIFTSLFYLLYKNNTHLAAFGLLWFLIAIAPRSTIVPSPELLVDYKTYPASLGWLFVLAAVLIKGFELVAIRTLWQDQGERIESKSVRSKPSRIHSNTLFQLASLLLLAAPLSYLTIQRNTVWRSGHEFWKNIIANAPGKARAYNNYGVELSQKFKKFRESVPYFRQAIAMDKHYPDPCNNLAVAYASLGKTDEAINALKQGLRINPYYPEGYNNLASFLLKQKRYDDAKLALARAIKLRPHYGKAFFNLGRLHLELGEKEIAWQYLKKCCTEADLDNELGFNSFGKCSMSLEKYDDALFAFNKMLELNPNNLEAIFNMGNAYYMKKEYANALNYYEKLRTHSPNDARLWYNLGEVHFALGNHQKSLDWFQKVAKLPTAPGNAFLRIAACQEHLGNAHQAHELLTALTQKTMDDQSRIRIKTLLSDLEKRHPEVMVT